MSSSHGVTQGAHNLTPPGSPRETHSFPLWRRAPQESQPSILAASFRNHFSRGEAEKSLSGLGWPGAWPQLPGIPRALQADEMPFLEPPTLRDLRERRKLARKG